MEILNWNFIDFSGQIISVNVGNHQIGSLRFFDVYNSNAVFKTGQTKVALIEKGASRTHVLYNGEFYGELKGNFFWPTLKLQNGRVFTLKYNLFGSNLKWTDSTGKLIMRFVPDTLTSKGRGTINTNDTMHLEQKEVLLSSGLFAQKMMVTNLGLYFVIFVPVITLIVKWLSKYIFN